MKDKTPKKRSFRALIGFLYLLIALGLSFFFWEVVYIERGQNDILALFMYILMSIANFAISFECIKAIMTSLYKRTLEQTLDTKPKKVAFALATIILTLLIALICEMWLRGCICC